MNKATKWVLGILFNPIFTIYIPIFYLKEVAPAFNFSGYSFPPFLFLSLMWVFGGIAWGLMLAGEFDE